MSDIGQILPDYVSEKHGDVLQALEDALISTSDLVTIEPIDLARLVNVPVSALAEVSAEILAQLHGQVDPIPSRSELNKPTEPGVVSFLDADLDKASGGGIRTRAVTEIVGPSGAGKTQFLLFALLSAQLKPPYGLNRPTLYISTEHTLPTQRLAGIIESNDILNNANPRPSLAKILTLHCPDLETQDHVLQFQLPVLLSRHDVGLIVIDSIAANYRAEDVRNARSESRGGASSVGRLMSNRSSELVRLGASLRELARRHDCAILIANQVSDRLDPTSVTYMDLAGSKSPASSPAAPPSSTGSSQNGTQSVNGSISTQTPRDWMLPSNILSLDHQQRWFSGWGDSRPGAPPGEGTQGPELKVPALGLVWTNQIACRIALHRHSDWVRSEAKLNVAQQAITSGEYVGLGGADWSKKRWKRRIRLVFAPWADGCAEDELGTEYEIWAGGLRSVGRSSQR